MMDSLLLSVISALLAAILAMVLLTANMFNKKISEISAEQKQARIDIVELKVAIAKMTAITAYSNRDKLSAVNPLIPAMGNDLNDWNYWALHYLKFKEFEIDRDENDIVLRRR